MPQQNKPTKEELKAAEDAAIAEAEKLEKESAIPEPEVTPNPESEEEPEPTQEETPEEPEEEQAEPSEEEKEKLKKKLSASARENQKIYAKNRVINKGLTDAEDIPEPTEEELVKEYSDWDLMSDVEKTLAKETIISRNWRKVILEAKNQATKIEKWNESVEEFVDDPKNLITYPDLEGKTDEFKTFATEETNNSVPFKILVSAFLHDHSSTQKSNKGRMFEKGSGGSNEKPIPNDGTINLEQARKLRETNYPKYKEYLIAGKIKSDF